MRSLLFHVTGVQRLGSLNGLRQPSTLSACPLCMAVFTPSLVLQQALQYGTSLLREDNCSVPVFIVLKSRVQSFPLCGFQSIIPSFPCYLVLEWAAPAVGSLRIHRNLGAYFLQSSLDSWSCWLCCTVVGVTLSSVGIMGTFIFRVWASVTVT